MPKTTNELKSIFKEIMEVKGKAKLYYGNGKELETILNYLEGSDLNDIVAVQKCLKEKGNWKPSTMSKKFKQLNSFFNDLPEKHLEMFGVEAINRASVVKHFAEVRDYLKGVADDDAPRTKKVLDISLPSKETYEAFVAKVGGLIEVMLNERFFDLEEMMQFQMYALVILYAYLPNLRTIYHTIRWTDYTDRENFILKPQYTSKMLVYNAHKKSDLMGEIVHSIEPGTLLDRILTKLLTLSRDNNISYLFYNYKAKKPFTNDVMYDFVSDAHTELNISASHLRKVDESLVNENIESLHHHNAESHLRGHNWIQALQYTRQLPT